MGRSSDGQSPGDEVDAWHRRYVEELDNGACLTPEEFVGRIADRRLREAVLNRLLLFERALTTLAGGPENRCRELPEIPGFRLEREIGHGGDGVVYSATSDEYPGGVAIKLMPLAGVTARALRRFVREFHVLSEINHPAIVRTFGMGRLPFAAYMVMEWVDGSSLATIQEQLRGQDPAAVAVAPAESVLRRVEEGALRSRRGEPAPADPGGLPEGARVAGAPIDRNYLDWVIDSFIALTNGLAKVHERGIVHRDISPSNILIRTADRSPVLLDFGLARRLSSPSLTPSRVLVGKPRYVAPEHAWDCRIGKNPRADVYSLGVVLYEMLTFRHPFDGSTTGEILRQVMQRRPSAPHHSNNAISPELERVVLWALEKNPSQRLPSTLVMAEELQHVRRGERPLASEAHLRRGARRVRTVVTSSGIGVLLVLACLALAALGGWPERGCVSPDPPLPNREDEKSALWNRTASGALPLTSSVDGPDSEPTMVLAELDGDSRMEIALISEDSDGWDVVAYDVGPDRGLTITWSLRERAPTLATMIATEHLEPQRIRAVDTNGDGLTEILLELHGLTWPDGLIVEISPDARSQRFHSPVGTLPGRTTTR